MAGGNERLTMLRPRGESEQNRVTYIELFYDLVFVFAVTQLSHSLLEHLTVLGAIETLLLFLAVWWAWVDTSWVTNWLNPIRTPVRLLLLVLMLVGLVLSTSIPNAFEDTGLVFAAAYTVMQLGRSAFMLWALGAGSPANTRNFQRIAAWQSVSCLFWIAGGLAEGETRIGLWIVALAIETSGPMAGFHVPGLGRSTTDDWDVEGGHMAERCGLFIIIALGESILVTGATFADLEWSAATLAAFAVAFTGSVAMWWVYFDTGAEFGAERIAGSSDPGRLARLAYTYLHIPIVAGIIVAAVGDELILAHPTGHIEPGAAAVILGGPALYVLGNMLFKRAMTGRTPLSHMVGLGLMAVLAPFALLFPPLALAAVVTAIIVTVAAWETISRREGPTPQIHLP
jgi:low temperature requirement protein LtrA